ncbi:hypothetical protein EMPS_06718 [Entomortierella parvispora]|uniref:FAD-binding domain-containing protein n=1 Tax=Entomortierella parvispora TaxID=205924 RepID=A0A9P3HD60_9FUNG|nr:hypothetical protein EMPS_06718 [Entomortierella parvispora]
MGGISLAIQLEKAGIPYQVFERASEMKFLVAKECTAMDMYNEQQFEFRLDVSPVFEMGGDRCYIISRPVFHGLLMQGILKDKIFMNKKVLSMSQDRQGVRIECADKSTYDGDILVGADGAYSAVRQALYSGLKEENKLPASDEMPLPFTTTCIVGQTEPLDPTEFPELLQSLSRLCNIKGDNKPYSWMTGATADNRICWVVIEYLERKSSKENASYRSSEWGQEAAESMCKLVYDFPITLRPEGSKMTMGHLLDKTPKHLISKVMLEEKVFDTWYSGRTVLLGDGICSQSSC